MSCYSVVPAAIEHVESFMGRLRASDLMEIEASSGRDPNDALILSWKKSEACWVFLMDSLPIAIFGVVRPSIASSTGSPWMLGSEELNMPRVGNEVGKRSRYYVLEMKRHFQRLENYVDARQKRSIRWLKWCGFTVENPKPWGTLGLPFHQFWME